MLICSSGGQLDGSYALMTGHWWHLASLTKWPMLRWARMQRCCREPFSLGLSSLTYLTTTICGCPSCDSSLDVKQSICSPENCCLFRLGLGLLQRAGLGRLGGLRWARVLGLEQHWLRLHGLKLHPPDLG